MTTKRPVIIDTDPGNDDAQAIMLVNGCGLFDIRGICAVHGNVGLEHTAPNALYLSQVAGLDCPVCVGAEEALIVRFPRAAYAHGANGLGGLEYEIDTTKFSQKKPWDLMWEQALECEGELEIFAIGPLTNVALAVLKYPELPKHVKRLVIMGGAATRGNVSPYAEFNIAQDPHALDILLKAGFKEFVMVDLDCCHTAYVTREEGAVMDNMPEGNPWKPFFDQQAISRKNRSFNRPKLSPRFAWRDAYGGCDACAAFVLAHPECAVIEDYPVMCETRSPISAGQTVVDWRRRFEGVWPNVKLARSVDREAYSKWFLECLHSYDKKEVDGNE